MSIPTLAPPSSQPLSAPYVTPAMFANYPTWLDLDNLVPGVSTLAELAATVNEDVLADVLLAASDWAVGECEGMLLHAHWVQGEQLRTRAGNGGKIFIKPRDIPVRAITSLSYGWDPTTLGELTLPDPTMWIEDGREVSFRPGGAGSAQTFTGPAIQFGPRYTTGSLVYVNWSYIPGYPSTVFSAGCAADASSVLATDPTGILPGDVLRVYDQGSGESVGAYSEALAVASSYVPQMPTVPPAPTSIPLAAPTRYAHAAGVGITGMPRMALQAVIAYGVALLMRQDVSEDEPVSAFGPAARTVESGSASTAGKAGGLVNDAAGWLARFHPVLRT
jgi:hypothetical protein